MVCGAIIRGESWVPDVNDLPVCVCVVAHAGSAGHRGIDATYQRICERFVWDGMKELVRGFVMACLICVKLSDRSVVPRPMGHQIQGSGPNQLPPTSTS